MTYQRNMIGEDRLNGLAFLFVHRDVLVTTEDVLNIVAAERRREQPPEIFL